MAYIGVKNLTVFPLTKDGSDATQYGSPLKLAESIYIDLTPKIAKGVLYGDDRPVDVASELTGYEMKINVVDLTPEQYAQLFGSKKDSKGGIAVTTNDSSPYFAVAFESKKHNGKTMYLVLHKVKFSPPQSEHKTKEENIQYTTQSIEGEAIARESDKSLMYFLEGSEENKTVVQEWYTSPQKKAD